MDFPLDPVMRNGPEEMQKTIGEPLIIPRSWVRSPPALLLRDTVDHNWVVKVILSGDRSERRHGPDWERSLPAGNPVELQVHR